MGVCPEALLTALESDLSLSQSEGWSDTQSFAATALRKSIFKKLIRPKLGDVDTRRVALDEFRSRALTSLLIQAKPSYAIGFLRQVLDLAPHESIGLGTMYSGGSTVKMPHKSTSGFAKHNLGAISVSNRAAYNEYMGLLRDYDIPSFLLAVKREKRFGILEGVPSNVTTVPKTAQIDRVIAVEPSVNAFLQQGVRTCLEACLAKVGIELSTQPDINRGLARKGSLGHGLATIDLSNASDSISLRLLQLLLPAAWVEYIRLVSSPEMKIDGEVISAECIPLTMGNAITFPLQTLIFLAICYEVYRRHDAPFLVNKNVAVFGDDIIVLEKYYGEVCDLLAALGFQPNMSKSFGSGDFRESCGADWYCGRNVRGVYIKTLQTIQDHYVVRNLLAAWSYRHQIALCETLRLLDLWLSSKRAIHLVPPWAPLYGGIRVFDPPPGSYNSRTCMHAFTVLSKRFRARAPSRFTQDERAISWGALHAYLTNGSIAERPVTQGKLVWRRTHSSVWGREWMSASEQWIYDQSITTSGQLVRMDT